MWWQTTQNKDYQRIVEWFNHQNEEEEKEALK